MKKLGSSLVLSLFAVCVSCNILDGILDEYVLENSVDRTELLEDGRMHVVLVGTGGPIANERRSSQCTAIIAAGQFLLVDVGPGSARRSSLLKLPGAFLSGVLLTHYHSDHIGDLGESNIQSWIDGRTENLEVFGPEGVHDIVDAFNRAYAPDVLYRNIHHGEGYMPREAGAMRSTTITFTDPEAATLVLDRNGLKVYAFPVDHYPAEPAVGYRFEYAGNVVVITGDTKKTETLAGFAAGADILVSEILSFDLTARTVDSLTRLGLERPAKLAQDVMDYHMDPVQVGEVARDAGAGRLVLTHVFPPAPDLLDWMFIEGAKKAYGGPVIMGEDGMFFALDPKN
jgi:ribonuclease Z